MKGIVVFDLDGTLLCTHMHVCRAVHEVLALHSLPDVEDESIRMHIPLILPMLLTHLP